MIPKIRAVERGRKLGLGAADTARCLGGGRAGGGLGFGARPEAGNEHRQAPVCREGDVDRGSPLGRVSRLIPKTHPPRETRLGCGALPSEQKLLHTCFSTGRFQLPDHLPFVVLVLSGAS